MSGPEIPFRSFHRGVAEQTRAAYSLRVSACWRRLSVCDNQEASEITEPQQAAHVMACCLMMNELTSSTATLTGVADLLVH